MSANATTILILRHPETEANVAGRFVGRGDSPFTPRGERQLDLLTERIVEFAPDRLWTSPLPRAATLAEHAGSRLGIGPVADERLIELAFGHAEGLTWDEITERGLTFDYRAYETPVAPGGESRASIERRSAAIAEEIVELGGRHAVCTHGGVFRAMLVALLGLSRSDIWAFHIRNAAVAEVRVVEGHGMLEEFGQARTIE